MYEKKNNFERNFEDLDTKIIFCTKCVLSNQRPRVHVDSHGICSACRYQEYKRKNIDWDQRKKELNKICNKYRSKDHSWDVIVPSSGGKDSSFVAHLLKNEYGMHPLCVTWTPNQYTDIGYKNFTSFVDNGFLHITAYANGKINRKLSRLTFEEVGDNFVPFIWGQITFPVSIAIKFNIKLVFYGELGEVEYSGNLKSENSGFKEMYRQNVLVDDLLKFGLETKNYITDKDIIDSDLYFYRFPNFKKNQLDLQWMSNYHFWDPQENFYYASEQNNFEAKTFRSEGTYTKYASLDDKLDALHYYMAFIKFGIGRTSADVSKDIHWGHLTREEALLLVKKYDGEEVSEYLQEHLDYLGISKNHYEKVIDSFRLPHVWKKINGVWKLRHTANKDGVDD